MKRILLVRHAEPTSAWGGDDADPGLSAQGQAQAEAAAQALRGLGLRQIVSSPLRRCAETAAPAVAALGLTARTEPRVGEVTAPAGVTDRRAWLRDNFVWAEGMPRRLWRDVSPDLRAWRDDVVAVVAAMPADTIVFSHFIAINAILSAALASEATIVHRPAHASITEISVAGDRLSLVRLGAEMNDDNVR